MRANPRNALCGIAILHMHAQLIEQKNRNIATWWVEASHIKYICTHLQSSSDKTINIHLCNVCYTARHQEYTARASCTNIAKGSLRVRTLYILVLHHGNIKPVLYRDWENISWCVRLFCASIIAKVASKGRTSLFGMGSLLLEECCACRANSNKYKLYVHKTKRLECSRNYVKGIN